MRLLKRPAPADPAVSESERRLFGGPLRYDAGWANHDYARLEGRLLTTLRSMPRMAGGTLRLAWDTDRRALLTVAFAEAGQGVTSAVGLLVLSQVLRTLLGAGSAAERLHAALPALAGGALVAVLGAVLASWSTAAAGRLEPKVERAAHEQYLKAAIEVELEAIEDGEFRRLLDSAQWGPPSARRTVGACVATLGGMISLVATAGVLTVLHPLLLPMLLLIAAPRGWGAMRVAQRRYLSMITWVEHVRAARLIGQLLISRTSAPEVRVHGVGRYLLGHYRNMAEHAESEATRLAKDKAATELLAAALSGVAALVTYTAMGVLIVTGRMDLAVAGTAVIAVRTGSASLGALVATTNTLHEESLYVRDLERFVAEAGRRAIPDGGLRLPERLGTLRLEEVSFSYPDRDEPALTGVSLTIEAGTVVALVGENGSGKSTLVKLLAGLHLPDTGSLTWDGVDVREADREQVFDRISLLTQDFERWPVTARTNIAIGRPGTGPEDGSVDQAADVVAAPGTRAPTRSSRSCRTATRPCSPGCSGAPRSCPGASGRSSAWRAPASATPASSSWTSPPRRSTRRRRSPPSTASAAWPVRSARSCWSPTGCRGCGTPTSSTCCTRGGSSNRAATRSCWPWAAATPPCSGSRPTSTATSPGTKSLSRARPPRRGTTRPSPEAVNSPLSQGHQG